MFSIVFLFSVFLNGYILGRTYLKHNIIGFPVLWFFIIGSTVSLSSLYGVTAYVTHNLLYSIILHMFTVIPLYIVFYLKHPVTLKLKKFGYIVPLIFCILFIFSLYLFSKTFSYDSRLGEFLIASNVYPDFSWHLPFIRSFSLGSNFPAEIPVFGNKNLQYYFMYDFYVGVLEFLGLRIDIANNILSALSLTALLYSIYKIGKQLFDSVVVGMLAILFCLTNSTLSFINLFSTIGLRTSLFSSIWNNVFYFEGKPFAFDPSILIAGFWNLNVYVNQRQLLWSMVLVIVIFSILMNIINAQKNHRSTFICMGLLIGILPFWHMMMYISVYILIFPLILLYPAKRQGLLMMIITSLIISIPQLWLVSANSTNTIQFRPGFMVNDSFTIFRWIKFWIVNLGVGIVTIPLGFLFSQKNNGSYC